MANLKNMLNGFQRLMMAVTFAEAGDRETALNIMNLGRRKKNQKRVGLSVKRQTAQRPVMRA
jgi:hypothetical protein